MHLLGIHLILSLKFFFNANTSNLWNVHILTRPHTERVRDLIRYDAHEWICITTTTAMMMTMATMTTTMNWMALISMQHYYLSSTQRIHSSLASVGLLYIPFIQSFPILCLYWCTLFLLFVDSYTLFGFIWRLRGRAWKKGRWRNMHTQLHRLT